MEKVFIGRVHMEEGLSEAEIAILADFNMCAIRKAAFHRVLAEEGYYVGEGAIGEVHDAKVLGTIFGVYRLRDNVRTGEKVATIETSLGEDGFH